VEDLERGIDEEIAAAVKEGVTADELAKAQTQLLRRFIDQRRSTLRNAILIGDFAVKFNDPNLINTVIDKQHAVTLADVNAVAKKYLDRDQRTVIVTLPAGDDARGTKGAQ
jgi:predicted Zn-dependent peptidase